LAPSGASPYFLLQDAAQPQPGRLAVRAHPYSAPAQPSRSEIVRRAAQKRSVLEPRRHHNRQQHEVAAGRARHQEGRDRHLAHVETLRPHHRRKSTADDRKRFDQQLWIGEQGLRLLVTA